MAGLNSRAGAMDELLRVGVLQCVEPHARGARIMTIRLSISVVLLWASAAAWAADTGHSRLVFQGGGAPQIGLFVAEADGRNEQPFLADGARNFNATYSSDGRWIVFTSDRAGSSDVYRVRPDGTALERLTQHSAFDDQGVLSPEGGRLAFVSTREGGMANIWLLDLQTRQYTNLTRSRSGNFRPSWSPDGSWLAFTSDREMPHRRSGPDRPPPEGSGCCGWEMVQSTALYVMRADGSGLRRLTLPEGFAGTPAWSADGRRLAYYDERGQIVSLDVQSGARVDATSGAGRRWSPHFVGASLRFLLNEGGRMQLADTEGSRGPAATEILNPSWSPDGKRVIYGRKDWSNYAAAAPLTRVTTSDPQVDLYRASLTQSWSPDLSRVLIARPFEGESTLTVINADGSGRRTLYDAGSTAGGIVYPVWSPDGASIVFTLGRYGTRNPVTPAQLARIRSDGSGLQMLTQGESGSGYASFSPDGRQLVYRVLGKERGLRLLSLETGRITPLTTEADNFPAWSPRGDLILFTSQRSGDFEMYTIRPDGSGLKQLTEDHGNNAHGRWSPDGEWIVFTSTRSGWRDETRLPSNDIQSNGELVLMRADGSGARQITDDQWEQAATAWLPPAP